MDEAKAAITRLAVEQFHVSASNVKVTENIFSSVDTSGDVPGIFNVQIVLGSIGFLMQATRQWNPDDGFHFVLEDPPGSAMSTGNNKPWDEARKKLETQIIEEGSQGLGSIVMELKSDVRNEGQPANYRINIQFGPSSSNIVSLQVDSGSSVLWAQSKIQRSQQIPAGRTALDVTIADAARFQKGTNFYEIVYGSGKKVKFALFEAMVTIGTLRTKQVFGAAEIHPQEDALPLGIIGLGFSQKNSRIPFHRTLVVQLQQSGMIRRASYALIGPRSEPANSIKTTGKAIRDRGWLIIGDLNDELHNGITWCPALVEEHRSWVVRLNYVRVNGVVIAENQLALIDTGSSYMITSREQCDKVAEVIQGRLKNGNLIYSDEALKEFSFTFGAPGDTKTFLLNKEDLSLGPALGCGTGELRGPLTYLNEFDKEDKKNFWILGGIFIDNMVTLFDYTGQPRIGFATRTNVDPAISDTFSM